MIDIDDIKYYLKIGALIPLLFIIWIAIMKAISIVCNWLGIDYIFVF